MCIGLHTLPPCLLFCGNYILHESEYDVHIFCVALDIIIYPAPRSAPARMPGMYAQRLYARTHTSGRTKSVQDAPTTNDHDCTDAEPTKHTQPLPVGKGFGDRDREFNISFVKQPISVNRLQSDVIIVHQNLTLTLLNLTLTQFFTLQRLQIDSQCCIIVKV